MKRNVAEQVHELMIYFSGALAESVRTVESGSDDKEAKAYRDAVSTLLGTMLEEIMVPIYADHADLVPPELKPSLDARKKKVKSK